MASRSSWALALDPHDPNACKWVQLARRRNLRDLEDAGERGLHFDSAAADQAVQFFALLRHSKGEWAGHPFKLEPWQEQDIIRPLFGWKRANGTRRFRVALVEIGRKNGKSSKLLAHYLLHRPSSF